MVGGGGDCGGGGGGGGGFVTLELMVGEYIYSSTNRTCRCRRTTADTTTENNSPVIEIFARDRDWYALHQWSLAILALLSVSVVRYKYQHLLLNGAQRGRWARKQGGSTGRRYYSPLLVLELKAPHLVADGFALSTNLQRRQEKGRQE